MRKFGALLQVSFWGMLYSMNLSGISRKGQRSGIGILVLAGGLMLALSASYSVGLAAALSAQGALDLLPEVVDPLSGEPLPPGRPGELVLTTLQREALPLIRYRTGDMAVLTETPCACGSPLPRLQRVLGRIVHGPNGIEVTHPRKGGPVR